MLRKTSSSVKYNTGYQFYDRSYYQLTEIGSRLRGKSPCENDFLNLMGGLLAWNKGSTHVSNISTAIDKYYSKNDCSFKDLLKLIESIESSDIDSEKPKETNIQISELLSLSQNVLSFSSVVKPSKLIHFLSPKYFAMTDSNVARGISLRSDCKDDYIKYIRKRTMRDSIEKSVHIAESLNSQQ